MKEREKEKSVREDGEGWGCDERERERGREKRWWSLSLRKVRRARFRTMKIMMPPLIPMFPSLTL